MDIINKLNLRSYRTYFQKAWKSKHTRYVNSGQSHRQYRLKLLETEKIRDKKTAMTSLSGLQAMMNFRILVRENVGVSKIFKDRILAWQGIKA
ncbi:MULTISPECIES: hypothetical protein [Methanosarcina]|uniref:Uncharacterized protein n=1 Tax=Methanosarcina barkeri CM1 TaxID=796385 RepID=A0A0G3CFX9_METBA|nr:MULTISPECIES: hypothetical protein [Methanosarcina]AKJ38848.1 hypothetical protein MCM1_1819 [Methanosarcina barkeri CM1]OEC93688.1 hypothetical protein A9239_00145 [Methanosarcina sp. A14]